MPSRHLDSNGVPSRPPKILEMADNAARNDEAVNQPLELQAEPEPQPQPLLQGGEKRLAGEGGMLRKEWRWYKVYTTKLHSLITFHKRCLLSLFLQYLERALRAENDEHEFHVEKCSACLSKIDERSEVREEDRSEELIRVFTGLALDFSQKEKKKLAAVKIVGASVVANANKTAAKIW